MLGVGRDSAICKEPSLKVVTNLPSISVSSASLQEGILAK